MLLLFFSDFKRGLGLLRAFFFLISCGVLSPALAQPLPDLNGRVVRVAVENAFPPLQFIDPITGEAIGWEYDAMNEIARRLNFTVKYVEFGWPGVFAATFSGEADISMDGFTFMARHAPTIDFSTPYLHLETVIIIRANETRFTTAASFPAFFGTDDLTPFTSGTIGVIDHTPDYYTAFNFLTLYDEHTPLLHKFNSFAEILTALSEGDIDVTLANRALGDALVAARPESFRLVEAPTQVFDPDSGFRLLFPKGSDLRMPVDATIAEMHSDGTFERLTTDWFVVSKSGRAAMDSHPYGRGIGER